MKEKNHKKIVVASALIAGAALGGAAMVGSQSVSATDNNSTEQQSVEGLPAPQDVEGQLEQQDSDGRPQRPELSEEKKAEIKAKLESMTEEERQEWLESHKRGGRDGSRHEKPKDMTDEEWEAKKAEIKAKIEEKLSGMTEEEKQAWLESHKKERKNTSADTENVSGENTSENTEAE